MSRLKNIIESLLLPLKKLLRPFKKMLQLRQSGGWQFLNFVPPGHYYSPIPDIKDVEQNALRIFSTDDACLGIDLKESEQIKLLNQLATYYSDIPFPETAVSAYRYYYQNYSFAYGDAIILHSFMRHFKPSRVIEVGAGYSSAAMLDTNDHFLNRKTRFTFIEPYPELLMRLLSEEDKVTTTIHIKPVQNIAPEVFQSLGADDFLFIDSSHVSKIGSDVNYLFFHILPSLQANVIVHIHDIFWPFEYPKSWILKGRAWNEAYLLRSFLQFNDSFEVLYFNNFIGHQHPELLKQTMPLCTSDPGGSLWLRKIR